LVGDSSAWLEWGREIRGLGRRGVSGEFDAARGVCGGVGRRVGGYASALRAWRAPRGLMGCVGSMGRVDSMGRVGSVALVRPTGACRR
jgi:hypothetical protein